MITAMITHLMCAAEPSCAALRRCQRFCAQCLVAVVRVVRCFASPPVTHSSSTDPFITDLEHIGQS